MFDIKTLLFVITIALICRAVVMEYVLNLTKDYTPVKYWTAGSVLLAIGALLLGFRDVIPAFISILLGQSLIVSGWLLVDAGTITATERRPPWRFMCILFAITLSIVYWFTLVTPDFGWRTLASSLPLILFDIYTAIICMTYREKPLATSFRVLGGLLTLIACSNGLKTLHIVQSDIKVLFDNHWQVGQFYIVSVISIVVGTGIFIALALQNLQKKLHLEIEERKRSESALKISALVYEHSSEGMLVTDLDGTIISVNPALTAISGYRENELIGKTPRIFKSDRQDTLFYKNMWRELIATGAWEGDIWNCRKDGSVFAERLKINTIYNADGSPKTRVALFHDITQEKQSAELIFHQANYDRLTELANRYYFFNWLARELSRARRHNSLVALLFMDLNRFKPVNDIYGHEAGDFVLKTVAERWQAVVRECDMLARLGGDEFALIITGLSSPEDADVIAQKLIEVLQQPITLPTGGLCEVGTSIGIAIYPNNAMEMDSLIAAADDAMYKNKSSGHNKATFTEQTIDFTPNKQWLTLNAADLTGIDKMDNQHRTLVGMINEINRGLYRDVKDSDLENHLKELVTYTTAHFEMEHGLMLKYAYPDIEAHDKQHQHLEEEIKKISQLAEDGDELRLLQTMKDWLTGHIQQSDKPLGVYLIAKGIQE